MKAYKAFYPDMTCRGFQYEIGHTYAMEEEPIKCERGFHACLELHDVLRYYPVEDKPRICEVEILGDISKDDYKIATNKIKIVRELTKKEIVDVAIQYIHTNHKVKQMLLAYVLVKYPSVTLSDEDLFALPWWIQSVLVEFGSNKLRKQLVNSPHVHVKADLVYFGTDEIVEQLLATKNFQIRQRIAFSGKRKHRRLLVNDPSPEIRILVVYHGTSKDIDAILEHEIDKEVLFRIRNQGNAKQKKLAEQRLLKYCNINVKEGVNYYEGL